MEYLSCLALVLTIVGVYLIGQLRLSGQYLMLAGHTCWLIYAVNVSLALWLQTFILFCLTIGAINNWTDKDMKL